MDKLELTQLGSFINQYATLTPIALWRNICIEAKALDANDAGLGLELVEELIDGLTYLALNYEKVLYAY